MKKRNPLAVFFLGIITLGIYDLYWLVQSKKELNQRTHIKIPTIWLLFLPILLLIGCLVFGFATAGGSNNGMAAISVLIGVIAVIAIIPITFSWFLKFSKAVNEYTGGKMSTGVAFLTLWLLHQIGVSLVQDSFNDALAAGPAGTVSGMPVGPSPFAGPVPQPTAVPLTPPIVNPVATQAPVTVPIASAAQQAATIAPAPVQPLAPTAEQQVPVVVTPQTIAPTQPAPNQPPSSGSPTPPGMISG